MKIRRLLEAGVLMAALMVTNQARASFTGEFDPIFWDLVPDKGSVQFLDSNTLQILGPATTWFGPSDDQAIYLGPGGGGTLNAYLIKFDWQLSSLVTAADAQFAYGPVGGPFTTTTFASVSPGSDSGTFSMALPAHYQFSIMLYTSDAVQGKSSSELLITNFVPEASTLWAGVLLVGVLGLTLLRQLRRQGGLNLMKRGFGLVSRTVSVLAITCAGLIEVQATVPLSALPDISALTPFATFGNNYNYNLATVNGNAGISANGTVKLSSPSTINGNLYLDTNVNTAGVSGTITGTTFSNVNLSLASNQVFTASAALKALTPDQSFGNVSVPGGGIIYSNVNGVQDVVVIDVNSLSTGGGNVTFIGDPGDFFVLNISNGLSMTGSASITNGEPGHILVNLFGTGDLGTIAHINNLINGTLFIPFAKATLHSVSGAIYSGKGQITLMSGAKVNYVPFPNYSVGNRVWLDNGAGGGTNNNGIQDGLEIGLSNVVVELKNSTGTVLAVTNTDEFGYYRFDFIAPGTNYTVFIPPTNFSVGGPLENLVASPFFPITPFTDQTSKGIPMGGGVTSGGFNLGPGLEPLNEPDTNSTPASMHGPSGDTNDNLTIDFGFSTVPPETFSVGNRVWFDNGAGGGITNNGIQDGGELGLSNVVVELRTDTTVLAVTNTDIYGYYRFDGLPAGNGYTVFIPPSNFQGSGPLDGLVSSAVLFTDFEDQHNKGTNANPAANGVSSITFSLGPGLQPLNEPDTNSTPASMHGPSGDTNDNLTIDFGFVAAPALFSVGNRVWLDNGAGGGTNANGIQDGLEMGLNNVEVQLLDSNSNLLATTITDGSGYYRFDGLSNGTYFVFIPATNFLTGGRLNGLVSSPLFPIGFPDQYNKGSNATPTMNGVLSGAVTLGPGLQPTGEPDISSGAGAHGPTGDENDNLTIDFGFYPTTTLALLKSIEAVAVGKSVYVGWETVSEVGTLAFALYRLEGTTWVAVGQVVADNSPTGSTYVLPDPGARFPGNYTYVLFEDTPQGARLVGTYQLTVNREPNEPKGHTKKSK